VTADKLPIDIANEIVSKWIDTPCTGLLGCRRCGLEEDISSALKAANLRAETVIRPAVELRLAELDIAGMSGVCIPKPTDACVRRARDARWALYTALKELGR